MNPQLSEVITAVGRWLHVLAGIAWVGYSYFFTLTWGPLAAALSPEARGAVAPQLVARAMRFFTLVAVVTWLTGVLLLGLIYHAGGLMVSADGGKPGMAMGVGFLAMLLAFFPYDAISKSPLGRAGPAGGLVNAVLFCGLCFGLAQLMPGRALFIHLGGTLGTVMVMNAAMRLAPAQRKLAAMAEGKLPFDPAPAQLVAQRGAHNVVMSVAAVAYMVAVHFPTAYGDTWAWGYAVAIAVVSFAAARTIIDAMTPRPPVSPAPTNA